MREPPSGPRGRLIFAGIWLLFGVIAAGIGLWLGLSPCHDAEWFNKAGAIVILFAVASEYQLLKFETDKLYRALEDLSKYWLDDGYGNLSPKQPHGLLSLCSHLMVVAGIVINTAGDVIIDLAS